MISAGIEQAWARKDTPFHVDMSLASPCGGVYHSAAQKTVILRYLQTTDIEDMLALADTTLRDIDALRAKLIVCDLRPLEGAARDAACTEVLLYLIQADVAKSLALLTDDPAVHPVTSEVESALTSAQVDWQIQSSFETVAQWACVKSEAMSAWFGVRPKNFRASYSGSTYSIPELGCTVLRSSGDVADALLDLAVLAKTGENHLATSADAFIFDSSASPPVTELQRYLDIYKTVVLPFASAGTDRYWIHVRSGDTLIAKDAPPLKPLLKDFNIELYEVETMEEALRLLRSIRGIDD